MGPGQEKLDALPERRVGASLAPTQADPQQYYTSTSQALLHLIRRSSPGKKRKFYVRMGKRQRASRSQ
jgi:hypothetical protein